MPDEKVLIELVAKTDKLEKGMAEAAKATSTHVKGMVYFFAEASDMIKKQWTAVDEITNGLTRMDTIGKAVGKTLTDVFGSLGHDIFAPLKTDIKDTEEAMGRSLTGMEKFWANLKNSFLDLIGTIITQGLILAGFIELLNLIPPPGTIGTAVAKFLSGGVTFFKGTAENVAGDIEGAMQTGGVVPKFGKYLMHPGELVIPPQGALMENFAQMLVDGLSHAMYPQMSIPQQPVIEISPELDGIVKLTAKTTTAGKRQLGRNIRKAIGEDKRTDV